MRTTASSTTWALAIAAGLGGCTPDFESASTVRDLRVLAIAADRPEIVVSSPSTFLDGAALATLPETIPVSLEALVVDPAGGGREVSYRVVACGNVQGEEDRGRNMGPAGPRETIARAACPSDALPIQEGRATPATPGEIVVPLSVAASIPRSLVEAAVAKDRAAFLFGTPIILSFVISAGDEQVTAIKRIIFLPRVSDEQRENANPVIAAVSHRYARPDAKKAFDLANPDENPPLVSLGGELVIEPEKGETESYWARTIKRVGKKFSESIPVVERVERETLRYSFFATAGIFSPEQVSTEPSPLLAKAPEGLVGTYEAPRAVPGAPVAPGGGVDGGPGMPGNVDVWIVVRDERGGASWKRLAVRLVP